MSNRSEIYGLVLIGGGSSRMGTDKSKLSYHSDNQRDHLWKLMSKVCNQVYFSCRAAQLAEFKDTSRVIVDSYTNIGPMAALLSAFEKHPSSAWFTVACDMPFINLPALNHLIRNRDAGKMATAYLNASTEKPEPLISIWEPQIYPLLKEKVSEKKLSLQHILMEVDCELLELHDQNIIVNANTPLSYQEIKNQLK